MKNVKVFLLMAMLFMVWAAAGAEEITDIDKVYIAGTVNNFSLGDSSEMKKISGKVFQIGMRAPKPSKEAWVTAKGANQSIKFVINKDWKRSYISDNGKLILDSQLDNIYVTMEEGRPYIITADFDKMTFGVEIDTALENSLSLKNGNEFIAIDDNTVKFLFRTTKGVKATLLLGEKRDELRPVKSIENYDYESEEGFKAGGFKPNKSYYYKIIAEKDGKTMESDIYSIYKYGNLGKITRPEWARKAVFYQVFVRSFYDGNNDGIGDFIGLKSKISYLKGLGVTALWLMPMNESPTYHGYDVIDYESIEKDYGGMKAFDEFLKEAHKNGIKVIMDLVLNHTSSEHKWFQDAVKNAGSRFKDYFVWANEFDGITEKWHKAENNRYYYGFYESKMPDLNYRNPAVREAAKRIAKFWTEKGIDGFRLDGSDNIDLDHDVTYGWWKEFSAYVNETAPEAFVVGENNFPGNYERVAPFHAAMESSFNFFMYDLIVNTSKGAAFEMINKLDDMYKAYSEKAPEFLDTTFLGNHDKPRLMSVLMDNPAGMPAYSDKERAKLAISYLMTLPGTPFIYYGDELGQTGGVAEMDENKREPMDWYTGAKGKGMTTMAKGGFRTGPKHTFSFDGISVEEQSKDKDSLLNYYKKLISIRKKYDILFKNQPKILGTPANTRGYVIEGDKYNVYVIHNTSNKNINIDMAGNAKELITDKLYEAGGKIIMSPMETVIFAGKTQPFAQYQYKEPVQKRSKVVIKLNVPKNTPADDEIFAPGSINEWGNNPKVKVNVLKKNADGQYEMELEGDVGTSVEYKFVRGTNGQRDWGKDGLDKSGVRLGTNFIYSFKENNETVTHNIFGWLDLGMPK